MADLTDASIWEAGIYQLETTDPVQGGAGGIDNRQAQELANRTLYLKDALEQTDADLAALALLVPDRTVLDSPLLKGHFINTVPGTTFALSAAEAPIGSIVILKMLLRNTSGNSEHSITGPNNVISLFLNSTTKSEIQGMQLWPIATVNDRNILYAYNRMTNPGSAVDYGEIYYGGFF